MRLLKIGDKNDDVLRWQYFLIGKGFYHGEADGEFGDELKSATIVFQSKYGLEPDGIAGNKTIGMAMTIGFGVLEDRDTGLLSANWPPKPKFKPLVTNEERAVLFGKFSYKHKPVSGNPENIVVTDNWAKENIILVKIPQLVPIKGSDKVYFHQKGAEQLIKLWSEWERYTMLHKILTWEGSYMPRFVRGSTSVLSNHAFGTAFDINAAWNWLGAIPALVGRKGSVRELVSIANENGFYWGGHFGRTDGMHFELTQIK
ncbi:MAG: M15 family metallopeptidase [Bacteroidia bacterium]|nr:M15 family metallopeptidase [Bacteroidia bacterium]